MTTLAHDLGLSSTLAFHDVFSIDDESLLAFVPRPALALLLVFPVSKSYEEFRVKADVDRESYDGSGSAEPVLWFRQTIRNACGLMGLLHAVCNGDARNLIGELISMRTTCHAGLTIGRQRLPPRYSPPRRHPTHSHPTCRAHLQFQRSRNSI